MYVIVDRHRFDVGVLISENYSKNVISKTLIFLASSNTDYPHAFVNATNVS